MTINVQKKLAGVLVPAFALRRTDDLGIGDTTCVMEAIDFCRQFELGVLQLLPVNETGADNSPYNAISSVALDPVYLDLTAEKIPGLNQAILEKQFSGIAVGALKQGAVQYPQVKSLKLSILNQAYTEFCTGKGDKLAAEQEAFNKFKQDQTKWLPTYTLFRALMEIHGNALWTSWPAEQRSYKQACDWLGKQSNSEDIERRQEFFAYVQWLVWRQWLDVRRYADSKSVKLMGDIPFGVSRYSADVWANEELFDLDWSGGAPPEPLFQEDVFTAKWGQNWGLPLYRWDQHKQTGYAWWRQRVTKCTEVFHYFRIDHVLGFFRIYSFPWIPERNPEFVDLSKDEAAQKTGGRLPGFLPRSDEKPEWKAANCADGRHLLEMILDAAGDHGVVAEDLGVVPDYVRPLLTELGIPGFTIPYWEHEKDHSIKAKETLRELSLATWATHDHMPLVTFYQDLVKRWHGPEGHQAWLEVQRLAKFLGLDQNNPPTEFTTAVHHTFIRILLETPCWLAVFMITDIFGTAERFNAPGTAGSSNWSQRLSRPLGDYAKQSPYQELLQYLKSEIERSGRAPQAMVTQAASEPTGKIKSS